VRLAFYGIDDGAIAGATAKISLERRSQVPALTLIKCRGGHDKSSGAALEPLRIQKGQ
jgi:hypothetical protein